MSKEYKVIHKKSNVVNDGAPKLPQASLLEYGEIAVNYGVSGETLSIKNSADQIVTFPSRDIIDRMVEGKGYLTGYTETDPTVPSWAKAESKPSYTASEVGAMATSERGNYLTTATTIPSIAGLVASVDYDSTGKTIVFYDSSDNVVDSIDATDFIKDGMVDSVAIATPTGGTNSGITCLVVTFNTDAGKEDIEIPLSNIFNPANYYNKTQADQTFLSQSAYTEDEEVIASALNDLNDRIEEINVPSNTSDLNNDSGFITSAYTGFSPTGHTHSQYSTTAHTHTAAEVGAMATSERSNYLTTGTTLDNVADGTTRKLSDYSTTGHTHNNYVPLYHDSENDNENIRVYTDYPDDNLVYVDGNGVYCRKNGYGTTKYSANGIVLGTSFPDGMNENEGAYVVQFPLSAGRLALTSQLTAAEVGAMATSERGNYLTTATTIPTTAAEVGAMATSERSNYLTTGTTLDNIADGTTRKLSDYLPLSGGTVNGNIKISGSTNYLRVNNGGGSKSATLYGDKLVLGNIVLMNPNAATVFGVNNIVFQQKDGTVALLSDVPTETNIEASGFTKNALTGYTETDPTVPSWAKEASKPTYTAAEVGAMATSERGNYSQTGHTHTAAEVGAMATSERNNYLTTATTIPTTAAEVGAMATSERGNYLTTATTIPTESTISGSGFTKNAITGINVNGTAATVTNGVAEINVQGGSTLPSVTAADNGKVLRVVNGAWAAVMPTTVYTGTDTPLSSIGNDGDIYLQTS